jgi:peptide-methionine (S)-S-oxide reductase
MKPNQSILFLFLLLGISCQSQPEKKEQSEIKKTAMTETKKEGLDSIILGAGCFWCVEAVYQQIEGVEQVISGYSGGHIKNPPYREVCEGTTGHAEVCKIVFDPKKVSLETLLSVFWQTHNPTTLNQQGNDIGTQYRSAIFYFDENQKAIAEKYKKELSESGAFANPIVTEVTAYTNFYPAEDYHQNYYNQNGSQPYCQFVIAPKLEKFEKVFGEKLRKK